jgi:SAM-dependent methyltransferase
VTVCDINAEMLAVGRERAEKLSLDNVEFVEGNAEQPDFADRSFDAYTIAFGIRNVPRIEAALREAYRVLKPGAFLQFSITHPCFDLKYKRSLRDENGIAYAVEISGYFEKTDGELAEWLFSAAPPEETGGVPNFKIPVFSRTISEWLNLLADTGFILEHLEEPRPDGPTVRRYPVLQDARVVAFFLILRARKPKTGAVSPSAV